MTSTELKIGLTNSARPSSRVLKPPGGGHSNIFAEPEISVNAPRPKYNQQNSSNLTECIGSTDANVVVEKLREEIAQSQSKQKNGSEILDDGDVLKSKAGSEASNIPTNGGEPTARGRVPPGGYSSGGFW